MKNILIATVMIMMIACSVQPSKIEQQMLDAVKDNNVVQIESLLASGVDVDIRSKGTSNITPLGWAALWGDYDAAKYLIEHGADINATTDDGFTPLHIAAYKSHKDIAELIISKGADVNAKSDNGMTPLHKALERIALVDVTSDGTSPDPKKVLTVADLLLANHAEVNASTPEGLMPIHFAAMSGNVALVTRLLDKGSEIDPRAHEKTTPLYLAAMAGRYDVVKVLIARGADVNAQTKSKYTPLTVAVTQGDVDIVKLLLNNKAAIDVKDEYGNTPLLMCMKSMMMSYALNSETPGSKLIKANMPPYVKKRLQSQINKMKGDWHDVAIYLINKGSDPDINVEGDTPLGVAVLVGDEGLVKRLLAKGAEINVKEVNRKHSETYLHAAIAEGHKEVALILVNNGIDVNEANISKRTALHFMAVYMNDRELTEAIVAHGADINAKDKYGMTPLAIAERDGKDKVADVLKAQEQKTGQKH